MEHLPRIVLLVAVDVSSAQDGACAATHMLQFRTAQLSFPNNHHRHCKALKMRSVTCSMLQSWCTRRASHTHNTPARQC